MKYEYGIAHCSHIANDGDIEVVVDDWPEHEINEFLMRWENNGGKKGIYVKIRRPIGEWEVVE